MALTENDIKTIHGMLSNLRSEMNIDMKIHLAPLVREIEELKQRVDRLYRMVQEDLNLAFKEIEILKKRIKKLETKVSSLR